MVESNRTINILGFHTSSLSREQILYSVGQWIEEKKVSHHLMALNPIKV
jgi:hypothetical protein